MRVPLISVHWCDEDVFSPVQSDHLITTRLAWQMLFRSRFSSAYSPHTVSPLLALLGNDTPWHNSLHTHWAGLSYTLSAEYWQALHYHPCPGPQMKYLWHQQFGTKRLDNSFFNRSVNNVVQSLDRAVRKEKKDESIFSYQTNHSVFYCDILQ